ncbi:right-handed parallel beta-helix repeat-containing protein [Membranicola marinus]|uniref:Right-handed parallel beta-helix repeat-containing protein n=1 Tax=Membranihabitans marinus TaxID=1227546 RepID=A0A953HPT0_9BACT|nr:right-handed parallel beta-helix repeat-containing protein [Membranihabitans marinus]MBY5959542.1 right-handed parallel beta-helix repeat-containing protein [Membranihabitans marinus]
MEHNRRDFIRKIGGSSVLFGISGMLWAGHRINPKHGLGDSGAAFVGDTWVDIDHQTYGAKPDDGNQLGGGTLYSDHFTKGDYEPTDLDGLIEALSQAKPGEVVFIPDETEIDLTTYIYIDQFVLEIPKGVTLAGNRGHDGSKGALLSSDALKTPILIRALGSNVRISGLRIQGPNSKRYMAHHKKSFQPGGPRHAYYYKFPVSNGIVTEYGNLEIDNCDISAFSQSGIQLNKGEFHHIHHNFIHHCQYNGLGYGISHSTASSIIEYNLFDSNRHSIAGTGEPGCSYVARHNVELGISLSHCFDMHGGKDRKDGTVIAGTNIEIYNNTFRAPQFAIGIRGEPENDCKIYQNWFVSHQAEDEAVRPYPYEKRDVYDNVYGKDPGPPK